MPIRAHTALPLLLLSLAAPAHAAGSPAVAALQTALHAQGLYAGTIDGLAGPATGEGVRTLYAHLSNLEVAVGNAVAVGAVVGEVGATGDATGPHLHFEVRFRGAAVDPLTALP